MGKVSAGSILILAWDVSGSKLVGYCFKTIFNLYTHFLFNIYTNEIGFNDLNKLQSYNGISIILCSAV